MLFRTIKRADDTGGLDRERVREAVIRVRERRLAAAGRGLPAAGTGVMIAHERPINPYGVTRPEARGHGEER